jgi:hypothetical protein
MFVLNECKLVFLPRLYCTQSYVGGPLSLYRLSFGATSVAHSRVQLCLGVKINFECIQNKQTRESLRSYTEQKKQNKNFASPEGSYSEEVSLPDLTKIRQYGNPFSKKSPSSTFHFTLKLTHIEPYNDGF